MNLLGTCVFQAHYRGNLVAVRRVYKKSVELSRTVLMELKQVRDLRHDNINPFIGACDDTNNVLIVTQYGVRGKHLYFILPSPIARICFPLT